MGKIIPRSYLAINISCISEDCFLSFFRNILHMWHLFTTLIVPQRKRIKSHILGIWVLFFILCNFILSLINEKFLWECNVKMWINLLVYFLKSELDHPVYYSFFLFGKCASYNNKEKEILNSHERFLLPRKQKGSRILKTEENLKY